MKKKNPMTLWCLTDDYHVANTCIDHIPPHVADLSNVLNGISSSLMVFSVIDMVNGFQSVPLHPDSVIFSVVPSYIGSAGGSEGRALIGFNDIHVAFIYFSQ